MLEIFIILLVAAADQVTKYIAVQYLKPLKTVPILEGLFSLTYVENRGAALESFRIRDGFLLLFLCSSSSQQ